MSDSEDIAPSTGLDISDHELVSEPDGNTLKLCLTRPQSPDPVPCVYYIHGGGMATWPEISRDTAADIARFCMGD